MTIRERMELAGPLWKAMATRFEAMVDAISTLGAIVAGQNPHKTNDTTNVVAVAGSSDTDTCIDLAQDIITKYEAHRVSTSHHLAADSTNAMTEIGVPKEVYAVLNDLKTQYNLHHVYTTSSVHAGAGDPNTVTATAATTKATAVTLANQIKEMFNLHIVNVTTCHGTTGIGDAITDADLDSDSTWTEIAAFADSAQTQYDAHCAQGSTIHGAADAVNVSTATAVGTVTTALYAGLNDLKAQLNAHFAESGTSHIIEDKSITVSSAAATTVTTAKALANEMKADYNDHISRADEDALISINSLDLEE